MKKRLLVIVGIGIVFFLLNGCTVSDLSRAKDHVQKKDFEWIAGQAYDCAPSDEGCNQLHLIKGDACYRLAKENKEAKKNYECAVRELDSGIKQTSRWAFDGLDLNRAQTYENLCESIRNLQDMERGAAAEALTRKLVETSQAFLAAEPGNLAGIYFLNSGRYTLLRSCLIHPEKCPGLCENLKAVDAEVVQAMPRAEVTRYLDNYHRLHNDISGARKAAGCIKK